MKCDELQPLVFSISDLAFVDEPTPQPNFQNPHEHAVYKATEVEEAIAELKQKLEDTQATAYAESVDAGMRERRLKRALWLARAERAESEHAHWATIWFCNTKISLNINKSSISQDPYKSNTFRNASEWRNMWYDIASKCKAKAEEYK